MFVDPSLLSPLSPMSLPQTSNQQQPPWVPLETKDCSQGFCSIYCPQWCYIIFPPPPPFSDDQEDSSSSSPFFSPLVLAIIGIVVSAFILIGYYTVVSKYCGSSFCRPRRRRQRDHHVGHDDIDDEENVANQEWHVPPSVGLDEELISKITVCKYRRGDGLVGCSDCSVCLSEFQDEESLRLLPKCSHAFHVQCIDTWLKSHSNCPLCRASIVLPPPVVPVSVPVSVSVSDEVVRNDETVVVITEDDQGTSLRRSFSMDSSFRGNRVLVSDILEVNMEDENEGPVGEIPMKRSVSSGRFSRQGRGRNLVLPM